MNGVRGTDLLNSSVPSNILRCIEDLFRFFISSGSKWKHPPFGVSTEQYSGKHRSRTCVSIQRDSTLKHDVLKQFFEVLFQPCSIIAPRSRPQVDHVSS